MTDKEKIRNIIELFIAWNGETEVIDVANLDSAVDFIANSIQEEPVSEDLEEVSNKYSSCIYLEEVLSDDDKEVLKERLANTFKAGAKWQKNKMVQNTIDAHCFGFQGAALFSFRLPAGNYLVGSEVKVIVIKKE